MGRKLKLKIPLRNSRFTDNKEEGKDWSGQGDKEMDKEKN